MKADTVQMHTVQMPEVSMVSPAISMSGVLAFALELVALGAVTAWGWRAGGWLGASAAAAAFVVGWGAFLSPRAARPITGRWWPAAKVAVFGVSAVALAAVTGTLPAAIFLILALVSVLLGGAR